MEVGTCDVLDHMPIKIEIDLKIEDEKQKTEDEIEIGSWKEQDKKEYVTRPKDTGKTSEWKELKNKVQCAIRKKE